MRVNHKRINAYYRVWASVKAFTDKFIIREYGGRQWQREKVPSKDSRNNNNFKVPHGQNTNNFLHSADNPHTISYTR